MKVHIEWTSGVLRLLSEEFGGNYSWSVSVVRLDNTLYLKGVSELPPEPMKLRKLLRDYCLEHGIEEVVWERKGKVHAIRVWEV